MRKAPLLLALFGASQALLNGCDSASKPSLTSPATESTGSATTGLARIAGTIRDSSGKAVSNALIHVYRGGNDSTEDTAFESGNDGTFQLHLRPGKARLFVEKAGEVAQFIDFSSLKADTTIQVDSLRLVHVLSGSFTVPGVQGSTFSVRVDGSPLEATVSTSGKVGVRVVDGQESILTLRFGKTEGAMQTYRWRVVASRGTVRFEPIANPATDTATSATAPTTAVGETLTIHPSSDDVAEAGMIGSLSGTGSGWQTTNFGSRLEEALGGAYDGNTIGRLLWKYDFPDSLKNRQILSAKLVFTPLYWGIRPTGGQDLTIEGHRLLKAWKEGHGPGQDGLAASADNDGVSSYGPTWGAKWNKPLVGLDGVDAESIAIARATLAYKSLSLFAIDLTEAVKDWVANPADNHGVLFRSTHETDGLYLDYPAFASDDHADATKRPYLVLELAPSNSDPSVKTAVIQPGPDGQDDACVIGTFTGTGTHDGNTQGSDPLQSLGGSWDYNTVGRLLWKINLPDSLRTKTILSARAVFKVNRWLDRPLGGHDYKVEAYKMLRSWKEGTGTFPGQPNSATLDGVSSLGPSYGTTWNTTLVGFDGVDAEKTRSAYSVLSWNDTTSMSFDFTSLVKSWLENPSKNHGVFFRSFEELDPSFPNYPGFDMSEVENPLRRPKIVVQYK
jgi:hypothetical protein